MVVSIPRDGSGILGLDSPLGELENVVSLGFLSLRKSLDVRYIRYMIAALTTFGISVMSKVKTSSGFLFFFVVNYIVNLFLNDLKFFVMGQYWWV